MEGITVRAHIDCPCHNPTAIIATKQGFFCRNCSQPITYEFPGEVIGRFRSLKRYVVVEQIDEDLLKRNSERLSLFSKTVNELGERIQILESRLADKEAALSLITAEKKRADAEFIELKNSRDEYCDRLTSKYRTRVTELQERCESLEEALDEKVKESDMLTGKVADIEKTLSKIKEDMRSANKSVSGLESTIERQTDIIRDLKARLSQTEGLKDRLMSENTALSESMLHYRNEADRCGRIPLRDTTSVFMDYMTAVFNLTSKCPDDVRESILARTEYVRMMLSSLGLNISFHSSGDNCPDGRADIHPLSTYDEDLDGKVARINRFGCTFKDGLYADIPEDLTVYCLIKPPTTEKNDQHISDNEGTVKECPLITDLDGDEATSLNKPTSTNIPTEHHIEDWVDEEKSEKTEPENYDDINIECNHNTSKCEIDETNPI
ncbi:MAG: hypothetical protein II855_02525 [Candidatus Methanomethylophilaceae archaeon]|nr:hypothetical protein [Candidatus Methanomethylophilaceae archaeon]